MPPKIRIAANGYRLCDPLPKGEVLIDNTKREWILGSAIGSGGFGDIYSCRRKGDRTDDYVIKLDNISGPLFQEMNFYMRVAKESQINSFMDRHRLKFLGMPQFIATGIHDKSSAVSNKRNKESNQAPAKKNAPTVQYRFLVMERFGDQLEDWINDDRLTTPKVADIAAKMIDVLQYIHSFGYIHADIKGTNILKSLSKAKNSNEWFLVDFGLAERYCDPNGRHRDEKPDKKRANNGTVEYRSRDAHIGLLSRRSDIECLAFNLIQWLYGTLPWMSCLKDPKKVEQQKEKFFENLDQSLRKSFKKSVPNGLKEFLKLLDDMEYDSVPNYSRLKDILLKKVSKNSKSSANYECDDEEENDDDEELIRKASQSSSESTVDTLRMNSPIKRQIQAKTAKNIPIKVHKRVNKRKEPEMYVELSDSEDNSVQSIIASPPKRTRSSRNSLKGANNGNTLPPLVGSEFVSPNRRSARKPVPRYSTPLLFANSDTEDSFEEPPDVFEVPVLNLSGTPSPKSLKSPKSASEPGSNPGKLQISNETPYMKEMREMIERKKREKEEQKKQKKKKN